MHENSFVFTDFVKIGGNYKCLRKFDLLKHSNLKASGNRLKTSVQYPTVANFNLLVLEGSISRYDIILRSLFRYGD